MIVPQPRVRVWNEYSSNAASRLAIMRRLAAAGSALVTQATVKYKAVKANSSRYHEIFCACS